MLLQRGIKMLQKYSNKNIIGRSIYKGVILLVLLWIILATKQRIYGLSRVGKVFGRSPLNSLYLKGDEKWI